jgi:3',5'-cyclic AMP phosphodiesterase CpdA
MNTKHIRLAVISDLHCHPKRKDAPDDTYLLSDKLRVPIGDHPVESLLKIIQENKLNVDLTLCPGDFTDKANVQGFIAGWNFSLEVNRELKSRDIIATLGNHDVDAYSTFSNYSLEIAKGIKQNFPFVGEEDCDSYWSKGCVVIERDEYRVLVINSSHFHYNRESAKSGKVGDDLISFVDNYFKGIYDNKINIAMSHHHPIDHSRLKLGEADKIVNAGDLLEVLGKYKFDLFIHGHKHDPLLRYYHTTSNYRLPIFAAGSFSSSSNLMFTSVRNSFHIITINKHTQALGEIETWTYFPNNGWQINLDESAFAPYAGFGNTKSLEDLLKEISILLDKKNYLDWKIVLQKIPELKYLIPADLTRLDEMLKSNDLILDSHLWKKPNRIFNLKAISQ